VSTTQHSLAWFRSYLAGRRQRVRCGGRCSALTDVICGVPRGLVLGPILFILYTADLTSIVAEHGLSLHHYADDSQICGSGQSDATSSLSNTASQCVDSISSWMRSDCHQLSADKTELMWCSSIRKLSQLPSCSSGSLLLVHSLVLSTPFLTWVYLSTTILLRPLTFGKLCHAASLHFVTFVDTSPTTASVSWWCRLCT